MLRSTMISFALPCSFVASIAMTTACTETPDAPKTTPKSAAKSAASKPATAMKKMEKHAHGGPKAGAATMVNGPYFAMPQPGSVLTETFSVAMAVHGKTVTPAGTDVTDKSKGHHHIIIDGKPVATGIPVPADAKHIHYGKGQTETTLTLAPGKHTLTLQFADGTHLSYGPDWSKTISVEVKAGGKDRDVSFASPAADAKVKSPVAIKFAVSGMKVRPAGEDVLDKTTGHHHLVIDGKPVSTGLTVPADATHIHYGKGQTETKVELSKGRHTLTMQLADGAHASYGPTMSKTISIEVQ